jgi:hypothetical protein
MILTLMSLRRQDQVQQKIGYLQQPVLLVMVHLLVTLNKSLSMILGVVSLQALSMPTTLRILHFLELGQQGLLHIKRQIIL